MFGQEDFGSSTNAFYYKQNYAKFSQPLLTASSGQKVISSIASDQVNKSQARVYINFVHSRDRARGQNRQSHEGKKIYNRKGS